MAAALRGALPVRLARPDGRHRGHTAFIVQLGPFGGAQDAGPGLWLWALVYLGLVGVAARAGFARRDL